MTLENVHAKWNQMGHKNIKYGAKFTGKERIIILSASVLEHFL